MKILISVILLSISMSAFSAKIIDVKYIKDNSTIEKNGPSQRLLSQPVVPCKTGHLPPCNPRTGESTAKLGN